MKKHIIKYGLEFLVITLGLSLSFFVEYKRELSYKEQLKEQALVRILGNITQDLGDFEFNLEAHKLAVKSSDWILKHHKNLKDFSRDSIGFHLQMATTIVTTFVDNQEEYRSLQNSGLLELIENENLAIGLQAKYVYNNWLKEQERQIELYRDKLEAHTSSLIGLQSGELEKLSSTYSGFLIDAHYLGDFQLSNEVLYFLRSKRQEHMSYVDYLQYGITANLSLVEIIKEEAGYEGSIEGRITSDKKVPSFY